MNPPRPVINLHDRNWRTALKAALDLAFGDALSEPIPQPLAKTVKRLK
jgi:hypothetical protein